MPTVEGLVPVAFFGALGGVTAEAIRVAELLKRGVAIGHRELAGSTLYALLGALVFLFGWNEPRQMLETAVLGAAFPSLFANAVRAAGAERSKRDPGKPLTGRGRRTVSFWDYMASRV